MSSAITLPSKRWDTHQEEWTPEEDSPAWMRENNFVHTPLSQLIGTAGMSFDVESFKEAGFTGKETLKYHWVSATLCTHMIIPARRSVIGARVCGGFDFNSLPQEQRCFSCNEEFKNS